jgi:glycine cleavage system H protein
LNAEQEDLLDYDIPKELQYTSDNEWVRIEDDHIAIGVTDFAQQELGDIVYVELPEPGVSIVQGEAFGVIESVKAVSDLYAPLSGVVMEANDFLADRPELVNHDCYGEGWMLKLELDSEIAHDSLMDADAYANSLAELGD